MDPRETNEGLQTSFWTTETSDNDETEAVHRDFFYDDEDEESDTDSDAESIPLGVNNDPPVVGPPPFWYLPPTTTTSYQPEPEPENEYPPGYIIPSNVWFQTWHHVLDTDGNELPLEEVTNHSNYAVDDIGNDRIVRYDQTLQRWVLAEQ